MQSSKVRWESIGLPCLGVGTIEPLGVRIVTIDIDSNIPGSIRCEVAQRSGIIADERNDNTSLPVLLLNILKVDRVWKLDHACGGISILVLGLQENDGAAVRDLGFSNDAADGLYVAGNDDVEPDTNHEGRENAYRSVARR